MPYKSNEFTLYHTLCKKYNLNPSHISSIPKLLAIKETNVFLTIFKTKLKGEKNL